MIGNTGVSLFASCISLQKLSVGLHVRYIEVE